jgi:hypothetical protein
MRHLVFSTVLALALAVSMPLAASAGSGQHAAITITANSDFTAPGSPAGCACVTAGNGTPGGLFINRISGFTRSETLAVSATDSFPQFHRQR